MFSKHVCYDFLNRRDKWRNWSWRTYISVGELENISVGEHLSWRTEEHLHVFHLFRFLHVLHVLKTYSTFSHGRMVGWNDFCILDQDTYEDIEIWGNYSLRILGWEQGDKSEIEIKKTLYLVDDWLLSSAHFVDLGQERMFEQLSEGELVRGAFLRCFTLWIYSTQWFAILTFTFGGFRWGGHQ